MSQEAIHHLTAKEQLLYTKQPHWRTRTLLTCWLLTPPKAGSPNRQSRLCKHQLDSAVHFSTQKSERKSREPLPGLHFQKPCQFSHHYLQTIKHSGRGEPPNHQTRLAITHQKSQP